MKSGISYRNWFKNSFCISYLLLFFICFCNLKGKKPGLAGIEPRPPGSKAGALTIVPLSIFRCKITTVYCYINSRKLKKVLKYYSIPFYRFKFNFYTYFIAIHILLKQPEQTKIERRVYFGIERFPKSIYRNPVSKENKEYKKENVFVFDCYIFANHKLLQSETPNRDSN